ncbi:hypothetical protein GW915_01660 [bacterium]|nr:hypothetical protein [bacterium]
MELKKYIFSTVAIFSLLVACTNRKEIVAEGDGLLYQPKPKGEDAQTTPSSVVALNCVVRKYEEESQSEVRLSLDGKSKTLFEDEVESLSVSYIQDAPEIGSINFLHSKNGVVDMAAKISFDSEVYGLTSTLESLVVSCHLDSDKSSLSAKIVPQNLSSDNWSCQSGVSDLVASSGVHTQSSPTLVSKSTAAAEPSELSLMSYPERKMLTKLRWANQRVFLRTQVEDQPGGGFEIPLQVYGSRKASFLGQSYYENKEFTSWASCSRE